jgi:hypothetical protein
LEELESVRAALVEAQKEEATLALQEVPNDLSNNPAYVSLTAVTEALRIQLNAQAGELAALIAMGDVSKNYTDNLSAVQRLSDALASSRKDLAEMTAEYSITGVVGNVDHQIAKGRVENLDAEVSRLTEELRASLAQIADTTSATVDTLAAGTPTTPVPMVTKGMRARDALLLGAILGMCAGWVALNFKWLIKGMPSSPQDNNKEELV